MNALRGAYLVASKDLRIELRTGEIVVTVGLFAFLLTVLASLSFYIDQNASKQIAPGVLWITITFSGVLAMGRSWMRERDQDAMRGLLLTPIPRASIYLGKAFGALLFLIVVEAMLLPLVTFFFQLDLLPILGRLVTVLFLGTLGFVAAGTLFSAMSVRTNTRDLVLSIVLFPLVSPALLAGVVATRDLLAGAPMGDTLAWLRILVAFDIVFVSGSIVLFEPLTSD
jgi:heme exporter protein B